MVDEFMEHMKTDFEKSLVGELTYFLGLEVMKIENTIFISQSTYAHNLLKKFGLESARYKKTPIRTHSKITRDEAGVSDHQSLYQSTIRSLLYLTTSRPYLCQSVGVCTRYQANPKESHLLAVKRIIKYVNGGAEYGLWYFFLYKL